MAKKKIEQSENRVSADYPHLPIKVYLCDEPGCDEPWATKHYFTNKRLCKKHANAAYKKWQIAVGILSITVLIGIIFF